MAGVEGTTELVVVRGYGFTNLGGRVSCRFGSSSHGVATLSTSVVGFISWLSLRRKIKRKILLMKQERRRSRRSSEMSSRENAGAFKG